MTGTNVLNIGNSNAGAGLQTAAVSPQKKNVVENAAEAFSSLMNQNSFQMDAKTQTDYAAGVSKADAYDRYQYQDNQVEKASIQTVSDKIESSGEALQEFEEEAVELVSSELDVDEEAVKEVLESLGLTVFDLLNPQNLAVVVKEITGTEDTAELLLNSGFQELLGKIGELGENLMEQLDLTVSQMDELVLQMDQTAAQPEEPAAEAEALSGAKTAEQEIQTGAEENPLQDILQEQPEGAVLVEETESAKTENGDQGASKEEAVTVVDERVSVSQTKDQPSGGSSSDQGQNMENGSPAMTPEQTFEVQAPKAQETLSYSSVDALDIIEQIAENVKVVLTNDSTSMEMQLNPENLGKIYLNVSTKEGTVNAQIAAQNEAVKAALEVQIATLRDNLNQAGVKVDAIEVTVASHEFERNLEQNQHQDEQQESPAGQSARRNIRMDSLDELTGLMTEEEALVAQIMKDNGNSVDLTA